MNTIATINFHFQMQSEPFARKLYARWDSFFANKVERVADEVLEKLQTKNEELTIEKLELDLGNISEDDLDEQFPLRFREKLEEAIVQWKVKNGGLRTENAFSVLQSQLSVLSHFLLHGALPWNAPEEYKDIHKLFLRVLQENANELKRFLQTYGHYSSLRERLVYQLNDPELEKGALLLAPSAGNFIVGYVRLLRAKHKETEQPQTNAGRYRDAVWSVVYAYLLTQRSSYFDKKSFITQTILQLAATYNLSYDSLLSMLTRELESFQKKLILPVELFQLLASLQKELSEKRLKESVIDAAKFYRTLYQSMQKEWDEPLSESSREALLRILANPYACRTFLQHLSEPEIVRLVPIVLPHDSDFIIKVAQLIDNKVWEPKLTPTESSPQNSSFFIPHSSFKKWQIIFPILLEKRGTRFNRKQFVRTVLQQIAAHYNLDAREFMEAFLSQSQLLAETDRELKSIFAELQRELSVETKEAAAGASRTNRQETSLTETFDRIMQVIAEDFAFPGRANPQATLHTEALQIVSDSSYRKKIIIQTREPQRLRLIRLLCPDQYEFMVSYIKSLDKLHGHSALEAKAGGAFADVKWMFLFTVLSEMPGDNFNRRSFVGRVLQQIAAHYNLTYFDLLLYFHQEKTGIQLPFQLEQLLDELYEDEQKHWLETMLRNGQETAKHQYLACFKGIDAAFIKTFLQTLDGFRDKGKLSKKISGRIDELKWNFVFKVLLEFPAVSFNKKQFVRRALMNMAAHYHVSLHELLAYWKEIFAVPGNVHSKEIEKIILELYREQGKNTTKQKHENMKEQKKDTKNAVTDDPQTENPPLSTPHSPFVNNAGIVILSPYLPRLFSMLDLMENNQFRDDEAQVRAIYLIQYIVFGSTDFPEHEMALNKLLTGCKVETPLSRPIEPTEKEKSAIRSMLESVLQHWSKLKNTSIAGLREGFLHRNGKLEEQEDFYLLTVEEKAYDMLLDSCPWNFRIIKYPWMKKMIQVKWR